MTRFVTLSAVTLGLGIACWAQNAAQLNPVRPMPAPIGTPRYGNILFPGGTQGRVDFPSALAGSVSGSRPYTGVRPGHGGGYYGGGGVYGNGSGHNGRGRTVVVPYAVPVYMGGYGYGYNGVDPYYNQQPTTVVVPQQQTPTVIINQTFTGVEPSRGGLQEHSSEHAPENSSLRIYGSETESAQRKVPPPVDPGTWARDQKPNIYLIALKDSSVRQALGYWVEGTSLSYVTPYAKIDRVDLEQVDRARSVELNAERKLEFDLKGN